MEEQDEESSPVFAGINDQAEMEQEARLPPGMIQPANRPQSAEHSDIRGNSKPVIGWMKPNPIEKPRAQKNFPMIGSRPLTTKTPIRDNYIDHLQLYDEARKLMQKMNKSKEENLQLRTKMQLCDQELERKDKMIHELLEQLNQRHGGGMIRQTRSGSETHLVSALRRQTRELRDEIKAKEEEMKALNKNLKITKIQEMDIEIKMFSDECTNKLSELFFRVNDIINSLGRLKHIIEEISNQKASSYSEQDIAAIEVRIQDQEAYLNRLRGENDQLGTILKKKEDEAKHWKDMSEKLEKKISRLEAESKENLKQKRLGMESKREMQRLKEQLAILKNDIKDKEGAAYKAKIEDLLKRQNDLNEKIMTKDKKIKTLENKLKEANPGNDSGKGTKSQNELADLKRSVKERENEIERLKANPAASSSSTQTIHTVSIRLIQDAILALRLNLIITQIPPENLLSLVDDFDSEDPISIHELVGVLKRNPINHKNDTLLLARYLIEPEGESEIEYNEKAEEQLSFVISKLSQLVGKYSIPNETELLETERSVKEKINNNQSDFIKIIRNLEIAPGIIPFDSIESISRGLKISFSPEETTFLALLMFKDKRDIKQLQSSALMNLIEQNPDEIPEPYQEPVNVKVLKEEKGEKVEVLEIHPDTPEDQNFEEDIDYEEKFEEDDKQQTNPHKKDIKPDADQDYGEEFEEEEYADIDEDQMIEIAQKCFYSISEQMLANNLTIQKLFEGKMLTEKINGEETDIVSSENFIQGIRSLGITDFQAIEFACLIKVLAINEEEKFIKISDLAQILEDYGVREEKEGEPSPEEGKKEEKKKPSSKPRLKFEELDQISMVLLLALTEYLIKENVPLYDLFGEYIYQQTVKTKKRSKNLELINSNHFFEVLQKIGIQTEDQEHDNLRAFLCLDRQYSDKIYIKK